MLYDRFRRWGLAERRVNKRRPSSPLNTPNDEAQLCDVLSRIGNYLDDLLDKNVRQLCASQDGVDMQRLVANAHLAVTSQVYDTRAVWEELLGLLPPVQQKMLLYRRATPNLHPRVLTALFRLLVKGRAAIESRANTHRETSALAVVKGMFQKASLALQPEHPVRLLCSLSADTTSTLAFLEKFISGSYNIDCTTNWSI